ncbi:glutamate--tRNA ligase [Acuticoccus mangrovi]|uniref:Glutamate--tRNA ligase n=1 Tax=Acuticoccus mangrovi TaxID=2796142 RepID=A0A934II17_9HYPH|nr:glutamate--tRNA ligase [Acuticoccus mangrovi]MBJ3774107.1 glutamate--tRNA ligase [Acuticoccus mangrovi]
MSEVVRFAPSPTGYLHLGNARTALYNAFLAMDGGTLVLRYDDTDTERSRPEYAEAIAADLDWLGIRPDRVAHQSARLAQYDAAADALREAGRLYPCYETPEELERKRMRQRARGLPPIYDRAALALTAQERQRLEAEGRRPHWRFRLPDGSRSWDDLCRGPQTVNLQSLSDPVLVRADGTYLYTLTSVVDDAEFAITSVVRGEDHVTNSGVQIAIFEALGAVPPRLGHHNLLIRADGEPLSKRHNPLSLSRLREEGYEAMAVASLASLVGTSLPVAPVASLADLAAMKPLGAVSRGPATFDPADLDRLNAALLHATPFEAVEAWLGATYGVADRRFWETVRPNLGRRADVGHWVAIWREAPDPAGIGVTLADAPVLEAARAALPPEPWDEATFRTWTGAVKAATGAKGKTLFMPLRRALTGEASGPEMAAFLLLLDRAEVVRRLDGAIAAARAAD